MIAHQQPFVKHFFDFFQIQLQTNVLPIWSVLPLAYANESPERTILYHALSGMSTVFSTQNQKIFRATSQPLSFYSTPLHLPMTPAASGTP